MSEYAKSGVDHERKDRGLAAMVAHLRGTFGHHPTARVRDDVGFYASVLEVPGLSRALVVGTDGVGTKILVAQRAGRHDTVGIDCVAMNVNDVICVGADPIAMVDYVAVNAVDETMVEELGLGLAEGARRAEISIPGGELAQVREMVRGYGECHYDLVGTAVGVVDPDRVVDGASIEPGDVIVGIASTGLHSNGYSLARRIVFETLGKDVHDELPECGRSVAQELLEPTAIYVREVKRLLADEAPVRGLFNITGGGFTNLLRAKAEGVGFLLDRLPEPPPIFSLLQEAGQVGDAEMHQVFNMGVGFVVVVPQGQVEPVLDAARAEQKDAWPIGRVVADAKKRCVVVPHGKEGALVARHAKGEFVSEGTVPKDLGS